MTDPVKQREMEAKISQSQQKITEWEEELKNLKGLNIFFEIAFLDFIEYSKKTNFSEFCVFFVLGKHKCHLYGNMGSVRIKR